MLYRSHRKLQENANVKKKKLSKILYVEDDPDIQEITRLALEEIGGFKVKCCSFGKEAIEMAPQYKPEIILLDVMMPDMDGITTFKEMQKIEELNNIPIVFLTARVQSEEIKEYEKLGISGVIYKPFDPMEISDTVNKIWLDKQK
jgi:two-component system, OmpR family, response regulator